MPRLDVAAINVLMVERNIATKFALSQICGIGYGLLRELLAAPNPDVDKEAIEKLCAGLCCDSTAILVEGPPAGTDSLQDSSMI